MLTIKPLHSLINECDNEDLGHIKSWLNAKKLSLKVAKTQNLIIGSRQRLKQIEHPNAVKPSFNKDDENPLLIKNTKYLAVAVDQNLNWEKHLDTLKTKISRGIGMLKYSKKFLPLSTVQNMHRSLVEPYMRYCFPVWGSVALTVRCGLQKL